jgi:hypothetical protein
MGCNDNDWVLHRSCIEEHELGAALGFPYIFKHIVWLLSAVASSDWDLNLNPTRMDGTGSKYFVFSCDITQVPKEKI